MKSRFFNTLLIPVLLSFLAGVMTLYGYMKFDSLILVEQNKVVKLQSTLKLIDCKAIDKDTILAIAQGKVEGIKDMANILFYFGWFFIALGITNLDFVYKYLKRSSDKYGDI